MKCTIQVQRINSNLLQVTVDVGRDSLYAYSELPLENNAVRALEEIIPNRNQPVLQFLDQLAAIAREHRFAGLCILPGQKAMMAVARKFLKLLWGWNRSQQDFSADRVFCCASQLPGLSQPQTQAA